MDDAAAALGGGSGGGLESAAALQLDQLVRCEIAAEIACSLLPGACMQRLGVQQQAVQIKQAGLR